MPTWTQQLTFHPHVHCIIPAGGLNEKGQWSQAKSNGKFLFPVQAMSALFKGNLLHGIHQLFLDGQLNRNAQVKAQYWKTKNMLYSINWVAYAKESFGGPQQVLEYIGRYTHKICISNYRIENITDKSVTFRYTDRKANKSVSKTINGKLFLKLFAEHILPKSFVRIRHLGLLSSRTKKKSLALIRKSLSVFYAARKPNLTTRQFITLTTGKDPYQCPCCHKGEMVIIAILPTIRGSPASTFFRSFAKDRKIQII